MLFVVNELEELFQINMLVRNILEQMGKTYSNKLLG